MALMLALFGKKRGEPEITEEKVKVLISPSTFIIARSACSRGSCTWVIAE